MQWATAYTGMPASTRDGVHAAEVVKPDPPEADPLRRI